MEYLQKQKIQEQSMKRLGIKEELELGITNIKIQKIEEDKEFKREDLIGLTEIGAVMENFDIPAEGEYKDYFFEIDENYKVTVLDKTRGEKPTIDANILPTDSKTTVEIEVTANISEGTIASIEAINGATLKESSENTSTKKIFTVNTNGTYYFKAIADNGRSAVKTVTVNTLLDAPKISVKNVKAFGFTIVVNDNYEEELVTEYKYYVDGSVVSEGTTNKEYTVTELEEQTEYNIYVEAYLDGFNVPIESNVQKIKTNVGVGITIDLQNAKYESGDLKISHLEDGTTQFDISNPGSSSNWGSGVAIYENIPMSNYDILQIVYSAKRRL